MGKDLKDYADPTKLRVTFVLLMQVNVVAELDKSGKNILVPEDADSDDFVDISDHSIFSDKVYPISKGRSAVFGEKGARRFHIYPFKYYRYYKSLDFTEEYNTGPVKLLLQDLDKVFHEEVNWNTSFQYLSTNGLTLSYISIAEGTENVKEIRLNVKKTEAQQQKLKVYTRSSNDPENKVVDDSCYFPSICWEMIRWTPIF